MPNGFEKHGIKHSSPSAFNMYEECPAAWVAKYLYGTKFTFGVAPLIGTLVEDVTTEVLCGGDFTQALEIAEKRFNTETALCSNEKDRARIKDIKPMAEIAIAQLKPYGVPEFKNTIKGREQQSISLLCKGWGWELDIIGYIDYVFPQHNLIFDLKTTLRLPSVISNTHKRQGAVYAKAKGMDTKFLYVSPKNHVIHDITDIDETLKEIKTILTRQEKMLRLDAEDIKDLVPLNMESYYWKGDERIRKELFNV